MVKIQIDLDDDEDYIIDMYRAKHRLKSKEKAIKQLIKDTSDEPEQPETEVIVQGKSSAQSKKRKQNGQY